MIALERRARCWSIQTPGKASCGAQRRDGLVRQRRWALASRHVAPTASRVSAGSRFVTQWMGRYSMIDQTVPAINRPAGKSATVASVRLYGALRHIGIRVVMLKMSAARLRPRWLSVIINR